MTKWAYFWLFCIAFSLFWMIFDFTQGFVAAGVIQSVFLIVYLACCSFSILSRKPGWELELEEAND